MEPEFTQLLNGVEKGEVDPATLLPQVYDELRRIAAGKMAQESAGHTLQPTALVHEAWMRLSGGHREATWENRAHFFGAAAEAMRRILVDHARKKKSAKRGGGADHTDIDAHPIELAVPTDELLAVHAALDTLATEDEQAAQLVKLRYFVGMTMDEAATAMGMKKRSAEALWTYAKIQLQRAIKADLQS
jgi:RNA polymerase sigma factor (TIGR02999 family)